MYEIFKKAIISIYGMQEEIKQKAMRYYAELFESYQNPTLFQSYQNPTLFQPYMNLATASPMQIIFRMLDEYSQLMKNKGKPIQPQHFVDSLNTDIKNRLVITYFVMQYYFYSQNIKQGLLFAEFLPSIATNLEDKNLALAWSNLSKLILLVGEIPNTDIQVLKRDALELVKEIESNLFNQPKSIDKIIILFSSRSFKPFLSTDYMEITDYLSIVINDYADLMGVTLTKIMKMLGLVQMGESFLISDNYEYAIAALNYGLREFDALIDTDKEEFRERISSAQSYITLSELKTSIEYELGLAHYNKFRRLVTTDKSAAIEELRKSVEFLKSTRSDPIKGSAYDEALYQLQDFDLIARGLELINNGTFTEALTHFNKIIESDPDNLAAWIDKGVAHENLSQLNEALKAYSRSIEINPSNLDALNNTGVVLLDSGKFKESIPWFDKVLEIDEKNIDALFNKGLASYNLGKTVEAMVLFDKALKINQTNPILWYHKALTHQEIGNYDDAILCYEKALDLDPTYKDAWYNKALALSNQERYDETIVAYGKALYLDPGDKDAWNNKGNVLYNQGDYD